ncbi:MAG TPA: hypothetical protein VJ461_01020 [Candidatus Nanoarchaeia archaeon]|nr:hypothetical protein [Candidatus Nanoarchaeia archaeon]
MKEKTYLIGDTHFDHENVIRYCKRPFRTKQEMNQLMLENWNNTVNDDDFVMFMGDMSFGRDSRPADYWLEQLKGQVIFFKGSHDQSKKVHYNHSMILDIMNQEFLFLHDPKYAPTGWNKWVVHGHLHNNWPTRYALVNGEQKTINVSVELINYKPVLLEEIINKSLARIKYWKELNTKPEYY